VLVTVAGVIAVTLLVTLTAQALVSRATCDNHPVVLNVAVTEDIAPAVGQVAQLFNRQHRKVGGTCAYVQVTEGQSAAVTAQIDGQSPNSGLPAVNAWIPDSTLWIDAARKFPLGARAVQPTGVDVARSPLMLAMPGSVAAHMPEFGSTVGWNFLLPASAGGPPAALRLQVDLPDPTQSASGLATLVEMSRLLGGGTAARTDFTNFVLSANATTGFDDPISLASFVSLASPPYSLHPVTVTSEQAVIQYDKANPGHPLAARYPSGPSRLLGSPELDYPYVLTTSDPRKQQAAREFEQALETRYASSVVRFDGFRSGRGPDGGGADGSPATFGLSTQHLDLATPAAASEAQSTLGIWNNLGLSLRDLVLADISSAMAQPDGVGQTFMQEATQVSRVGLALFPDSTQMGLWEFSSHLAGSRPYKQIVPIGPLTAELGLISRRQELEQIDKTIGPDGGAAVALNDSILAAYKSMTASYNPKYANAIIVLTAGVDNAPGDLPLPALLRTLRTLYNPARRVEVISIVFGDAGSFSAMRRISNVTHGAVYRVTNPSQVGQAFLNAVARRTCNPSCAAP
jgi:hypothetical protein